MEVVFNFQPMSTAPMSACYLLTKTISAKSHTIVLAIFDTVLGNWRHDGETVDEPIAWAPYNAEITRMLEDQERSELLSEISQLELKLRDARRKLERLN